MASPFSWPMSVPSALRAPAPVNQGVRLSSNSRHANLLGPLSLMQRLFCKRCGEYYEAPLVPLPVLMQLGKLPQDEWLATLIQLTGATPELAANWLHHNLKPNCQKKVAHCPVCNGELRTWQAQWCPHCNHDWHNQSTEAE